MKLPDIAVRRKTTFLMVFILMIGLGVYGFNMLGIDLFPDMSLDQIMIVTSLPGAGPEEIESLITEKIEEAAELVNGVEHIESSSASNVSIVVVELAPGTDIDQAEIDLRNWLSLVVEELPDDASSPQVIAANPSMAPVIMLSAGSNRLGTMELTRLVEDEISPLLSRVEGVAAVGVMGGLERQINILAEPALMERHGISLSQIAGALAPVGNNIPAGRMNAGGMSFILNVETAFHDITEIEELVVGYHDGVPVKVGDVCTVEDGTEESLQALRVDGSRSVMVLVMRQTDANSVEVCGNVREAVAGIEETHGMALDINTIYDQSEMVNRSINNLFSTGVQAVVIAVLVLVFFLGSMKTAGIVGLAIPLSIFLTFPVMAVLGTSLNLISLMGLALAVGMLVDNSIVVLENIFRHRMEVGSAPKKASVDGASEVGMAIGASTLTTLAVFIPIMLVPGTTGRLFRDLSLTIGSTLLVSLFVALTLIPLAASRMRVITTHGTGKGISGGIARFLDGLGAKYSHGLERAVRRKKLVIFSAVGVFLLALGCLRFIPAEFLPTMDSSMAQFILYRAPGTELRSTDSSMTLIMNELMEVIPANALEHVYYSCGESEGLMSLSGGSGTNVANLQVTLVPISRRDVSEAEVKEMMRGVLAGHPDIEYSEQNAAGMFAGGDPIEINIYGEDIRKLSILGEQIADSLLLIDGVVDARSSLADQVPQISFRPNYDVLSLRAASPALMGYETNLAFMGSDVTIFRENGDEVDVNLRYPEEYRSSFEALNAAVLNGMPLESWGTLVESQVPKSILRRDQNRMVTISGAISGRTIGEIGPEVEAFLERFDLEGYRYEIGGQIEDQKKTFSQLLIALFVSALLVYMVMASQFESLMEPFIIILTVPLAISGAIFMLLLTNTALSGLSFVGLIMLVGIIVNNGIVMVDYANQLLGSGRSRIEAIVEAGKTRLRPILMTAATTVVAMIPMAIGSGDGGQMFAPMGRTVIGGLTVGTLLTLFVVPCLYLVFGRFKKTEESSG